MTIIISFAKKHNWYVHCTFPTWACVDVLHDILRTRWFVTERKHLSVPITSGQLRSSSLGYHVPVPDGTLICIGRTMNSRHVE
jgi:hypothetical protein